MERYDIDELGCMSPRADGDYVLYADAQRALDAEREKVKELEAMYRQQLDERDKRIGELAESAKIWMERRNTLQAQLADRDAMILQMGEQAAVLAKENMAVKAQLREVEGEKHNG